MSTDIVIVAAARTAVGKFGGSLAKIAGHRARRDRHRASCSSARKLEPATRSAKSSWARC